MAFKSDHWVVQSCPSSWSAALQQSCTPTVVFIYFFAHPEIIRENKWQKLQRNVRIVTQFTNETFSHSDLNLYHTAPVLSQNQRCVGGALFFDFYLFCFFFLELLLEFSSFFSDWLKQNHSSVWLRWQKLWMWALGRHECGCMLGHLPALWGLSSSGEPDFHCLHSPLKYES